MNRESWISDKGRVGNDIITPFKKLLRGKLLDWQKEFCSGVDKIHWMIEQVIFHFKNWQIMSICHRRLFTTFAATISAVIGSAKATGTRRLLWCLSCCQPRGCHGGDLELIQRLKRGEMGGGPQLLAGVALITPSGSAADSTIRSCS